MDINTKETQNKGRTIAIGDIHNAAEALKQLFERIKPTKEDTFIFIGDYVDGWAYPVETLKFLLKLHKEYYCIFLEGNHDTWLKTWLDKAIVAEAWTKNGGYTTYPRLLEEFKTDPSFLQELIDWSNKWVDFYVDDENRAFVHGGFTTVYGLDRTKDSKYNFLWDRTLWKSVLMSHLVEEKPDDLRLRKYKEIYIGHTSCLRYSETPLMAGNLINLDTGAGWHGFLSAMDINTKEIWQSDRVKRIYPDEFVAREHFSK